MDRRDAVVRRVVTLFPLRGAVRATARRVEAVRFFMICCSSNNENCSFDREQEERYLEEFVVLKQ
jgi:hypothetical protein